MKVFQDPWIPSFTTNQLTDQIIVEEWEITIDSLISDNTQWWNVEKIRALLNPNIVAKILKIIIPLAPMTSGIGIKKKIESTLSKVLINFFIILQRCTQEKALWSPERGLFGRDYGK